jgi:hypothetical protein
MHSAVLQNAKYIKFAAKNTVEVISLGSLQEGIDKKDKKAETYEDELPDGTKVEYLVMYPGMTVAEMLALNASKASQYNDTGRIPFTAMIDPHTEKEMQRWMGGQAASTLMEAAKEHRKTLVKQHGEGVSRKVFDEVVEMETDTAAALAGGELQEALAASAKVEVDEQWPQALKDRVAVCRKKVLDAAAQRLKDLEAQALSDAAAAKRELTKLVPALKGTELEARAAELLATL